MSGSEVCEGLESIKDGSGFGWIEEIREIREIRGKQRKNSPNLKTDYFL